MTDSSSKAIVNVDAVELRDFGNGDGFQASLGRIGPLIGMQQLGCMLTVVPPGKKAFPYHCHYANEEVVIVLAGSGEARLGGERHPVRAGDIVAMPAGGRERAHQIVNTGSEELRYLCLSTLNEPEAVEYPDSNKFGVVAGMPKGGMPHEASLRFIGRTDAMVDYFDGES